MCCSVYRGSEYSRSIKELIKEVYELVDNGASEITLLGQNVNAFKYQNKKLSDLIYEISKINEIKRIRYTTSHPIDFSNDLIDAHKDIKKLMPLIHLPVQSGSNKILKNMNRKHSVEQYMELIRNLKKANSEIKFSSDFIIGYPGETEKDFEQTLKLLQEVKFINTYSFIYSSRPGTPASKLKTIENSISKERLYLFQKIATNIKKNYRQELIGKNSQVMFENNIKNNYDFFGRDEYLNSVVVKSKKNLKGKILKVKILDGNQNTLYGRVNENIKSEYFAA